MAKDSYIDRLIRECRIIYYWTPSTGYVYSIPTPQKPEPKTDSTVKPKGKK